MSMDIGSDVGTDLSVTWTSLLYEKILERQLASQCLFLLVRF